MWFLWILRPHVAGSESLWLVTDTLLYHQANSSSQYVPVFPFTSAGLSLACRSDVTKAIKMNPVYLFYTFGTPKSQCSVCNPDSHTQERWLPREALEFEVFLGYIQCKASSRTHRIPKCSEPRLLSAALSQGFDCISDLCPHGQPGLYEGSLCTFFPSFSHEVGSFL